MCLKLFFHQQQQQQQQQKRRRSFFRRFYWVFLDTFPLPTQTFLRDACATGKAGRKQKKDRHIG